MRRREFITLVTGAVAVGPFALHAQQPTMPVIGFLGPGSSESDAYRVTSFKQGLKETGFVDKQNVLIEYIGGLRAAMINYRN